MAEKKRRAEVWSFDGTYAGTQTLTLKLGGKNTKAVNFCELPAVKPLPVSARRGYPHLGAPPLPVAFLFPALLLSASC